MPKKAAKKASGKGIVIVLKDGQLPSPMDAAANKNLGKGSPDRVRWDNQSSRGRTVQFEFDWWPFVEPPTLIEVDAGKKSKWYNISADTPSSGYSYAVSPPLVIGTGPDEPKISVGD